MKSEKVFGQQSLFDCSTEIKKYQCETCPNFQTTFLTCLKDHIMGCHKSGSLEEDSYTCLKCFLLTYSKYVIVQHAFFSKCATSTKNYRLKDDPECLFNVKCEDVFECKIEEHSSEFKEKSDGDVSMESCDVTTVDGSRSEQCPYKFKPKEDVTTFNLDDDHVEGDMEINQDSSDQKNVSLIEHLGSNQSEHVPPDSSTIGSDCSSLGVPVTEDHQQQDKKKRRARRRTSICPICHKNVNSYFTRHLFRHHPNDERVLKIRSMKPKCKDRLNLVSVMRKQGYFHMKTQQNFVIPMRRSQYSDTEYFPCIYCLGLYSKRFLHKHVKTCTNRPPGEKNSGRNCLTKSQTLMAGIYSNGSSFFGNCRIMNEVLDKMRPDRISMTAKNDPLICLFGENLLNKQKKQAVSVAVSNRIREMGRLLIVLKSMNDEVEGVFDVLKPELFQLCIDATKVISGYDEDSKTFRSPSLALHMGTNLKIICDVAHEIVKEERAVHKIKWDDRDTKISEIQGWKKLIEDNWFEKLSGLALRNLYERKEERSMINRESFQSHISDSGSNGCNNSQHASDSWDEDHVEEVTANNQDSSDQQTISLQESLGSTQSEHVPPPQSSTFGSDSSLGIPITEDHQPQDKKKRRTRRKTSICPICHKNVTSHFTRHLFRHHPNDERVLKIRSMKPKCKDRLNLVSVMRKQGYFHMKTQQNFVIPMRRSQYSDTEYFPCIYCLGLYSKKFLYKHVKTCTNRPPGEKNSGRNCLTKSQTMMAEICSKSSSFLGKSRIMNEVFDKMRPDDISMTAKNDPLICLYGESLLNKQKKQALSVAVSNKIREMGRLLIEMKSMDDEVEEFFDALKPELFRLFIDATKVISGYDEDSNAFRSPSLALHMGPNLKILCDVAHEIVMEERGVHKIKWIDRATKISEIQRLRKLIEDNWCEELSDLALKNLNERKEKKYITSCESSQSHTNDSDNETCETNIPRNDRNNANPTIQSIGTGGPQKISKRGKWTVEEKQIVINYFSRHIKHKISPKKHECEQLIADNKGVLNKDWVKVKVLVYNTYRNK